MLCQRPLHQSFWHLSWKLYMEMIICKWRESEESWRKQNKRETVGIPLLLNAKCLKAEVHNLNSYCQGKKVQLGHGTGKKGWSWPPQLGSPVFSSVNPELLLIHPRQVIWGQDNHSYFTLALRQWKEWHVPSPSRRALAWRRASLHWWYWPDSSTVKALGCFLTPLKERWGGQVWSALHPSNLLALGIIKGKRKKVLERGC